MEVATPTKTPAVSPEIAAAAAALAGRPTPAQVEADRKAAEDQLVEQYQMRAAVVRFHLTKRQRVWNAIKSAALPVLVGAGLALLLREGQSGKAVSK